MNKDLSQELHFLKEIDKLKAVLRQVLIQDKSRKENTAEHSWHLAMAVLVLRRHAGQEIDVEKAIKLALIHDIVEIDAGDTFAYDTKGAESKHEKEVASIKRLTELLPSDLGKEISDLWYDFELKTSFESKFVSSLDRALPIIANYETEGHAWRNHGISKQQVIERNKEIQTLCPHFWDHLLGLLDDAQLKGWLK